MQLIDVQPGGTTMIVWYAIVSIGIAFLFRRNQRPLWKAFWPVVNVVELCVGWLNCPAGGCAGFSCGTCSLRCTWL